MISEEYKNKVKENSHWNKRSSPVKRMIPLIRRIFKENKKIKLIDVGCAQGKNTNEFYKNKINAEGIDIDSDFIKEAKKRFPNIKFKIGDIEKLPYNNHTFDIIFCINTLFYTNINKSIKELERVVKKGGIEIITLDSEIKDLDKNKMK